MTVPDDIELLSHSRSPKRRAAAKRLRKSADPTAGPALIAALEKELNDDRTWETQYQLIMAIGHCNYCEALPFVESLVPSNSGGMVNVAIGDTLLRLSRKHVNDASRCVDFIDAADQLLTHGAMQAIAMLRMLPDETTMARLIEHGMSLKLGDDDWTLIWLLRATPGWPGEFTSQLLDKWNTVSFAQQQQIHGAVELARKCEYAKWKPL
jgi:hypothetical protein